MKSILGPALGLWMVWPGWGAAAANEAQALFHCLSVRLAPASLTQAGLTYTLAATSADDGTINDEISLSENPDWPYFYTTRLRLTDPTAAAPIAFEAYFDLPNPDLNRNGASDFLEVNLRVNRAVSLGEFIPEGAFDTAGTLDLTWDRAAGASTGTCRLRLVLADLGLDLTFQHLFEVFDYRGSVAYGGSGTNISGEASLVRLGAPGSLRGPFPLTRLDENELRYPATAWTNELGQPLRLYAWDELESPLLRGALGTNYYGTLGTADGRPSTPTTGEYQLWFISLFDPNDSNGNGIPDLSDSPPPPEPPRLGWRREADKLWLQVQAQEGRRLVLEQAQRLPATNWSALPPITLTNAVQDIALPPPEIPPAFWRARLE